MKLENQVCSLELAKRLKELGVKQDSLWVWVDRLNNSTVCLSQQVQKLIPIYSAFTVSELGGAVTRKNKY